jgi:hypothetical protein
MQDRAACNDWFLNALNTPTSCQPSHAAANQGGGSASSMDSAETQLPLPASAPQQSSQKPCATTISSGFQAVVRRSLFGAPTRQEVDGFLGQLEAQLKVEGKLSRPG